MELPDLTRISIDRIPASFTGSAIPVDVIRLDKIHTVISGNKWFKLHKYLEQAENENKKRIVSFGGPWSNHIIAVAAAARLSGFSSLGIIRGEHTNDLNPVLQQCRDWDMELVFHGRQEFDQGLLPIGLSRDDDLLIPMGGYGRPGMEGAGKMLDHCDAGQYSHICCATGTGTMMAGLISRISNDQQVIGYSAVKNDPELEENIKKLTGPDIPEIHYSTDRQFGGFARYNEELIRFMNALYEASGIPTDIVYTAKLFYRLFDDLRSDKFPEGSRILVIHSGGLTGNYSVKNGLLIW